jgi:DNA gyrase subunit B
MTKKTARKPDTYDSGSIRQLRGLEAVREKIGMYLGDPTSGDALHHLIEEVVANSVDEHLGGHCKKILVELLPNGWCRVTDDGRGIPVGLHPEEGIDTLQMVMTSLHAGGKFDNDSYKVSAGLHGIGVSAVNAVSTDCIAEVHRDGKHYVQCYQEGKPIIEVLVKGKSKLHGTTISWQRDDKIFSGVMEYDAKRVKARLQELAFLNPGLSIVLEDTREEGHRTQEFLYEGGLKDFLAETVGKKQNMVPIMYFKNGDGSCEMAMTWHKGEVEEVRCYANNTYNADGGTHRTGFYTALTRLVVGYVKEHEMTRGLGDDGVLGSDVREGLIAVVSVKLSDISFSSQTKDKLVSPKAKTIVEDLFNDQVAFFFHENPGTMKKIADRAVLSAKMREAARKAKDQVKRKDFMDLASLPGKLTDCQSKIAEECELLLVEGDSAGGTTKTARDRRFQAVLPLRGKVLNTERARVETLMETKELGTMITALGCGIEQANSFDIKKLRYHKIVIMTDADVDGAHIRCLLLTFFYRTMPRLLYYGHVYIAQPPLYGTRTGGAQNTHYHVTEADLNAYRDQLSPHDKKALRITRYKGLGEMNAEALWATTLDPEHRILVQVTVDDAIKAETMVDLLMGDEVQPRREFIQEHADEASLDF